MSNNRNVQNIRFVIVEIETEKIMEGYMQKKTEKFNRAKAIEKAKRYF